MSPPFARQTHLSDAIVTIGGRSFGGNAGNGTTVTGQPSADCEFRIAFVLRAKMRPHSRTIFGLAGEDEC
jgi:hypothetical protein